MIIHEFDYKISQTILKQFSNKTYHVTYKNNIIFYNYNPNNDTLKYSLECFINNVNTDKYEII